MKKYFCPILTFCCLLSTQLVNAQIQFRLSHKPNSKTYVVSLIPEKTFNFPDNIVSTAQFTIKVETNRDFMLGNFKELVADEKMMNNGVIKSPELSPKYDYYSYGLQTMGSSNYALTKGKEVELFSFDNLGNDEPMVALIDNDDIMVKSIKKTHINLGNQISLLGVGGGISNAYTGNFHAEMPNDENLANLFSIENVFPNPATDKVSVVWVNNHVANPEGLALLVIDSNTGIITKTENILNAPLGKNNIPLNVSQLKEGTYLFKLQTKFGNSKATHVVIVH